MSPATYALVLVVSALAGARTWRLASIDEIALPFRNLYFRVFRRHYEWAAKLMDCPFCLGFWLTTGWVLTGLAWGDTVWWWVAAGPFAANYLGAQLNAWLDVRPIEDKNEIGDHE